MDFTEDTATRGGIRWVTCPNPALHSKRHEILLLSLLEHFRGIGQPMSRADQDALRGRIATAECLLRETTSPGKIEN